MKNKIEELIDSLGLGFWTYREEEISIKYWIEFMTLALFGPLSFSLSYRLFLFF